jgi:hypothetical protein
VSDIKAAHAELAGHSVDIGEQFHASAACSTMPAEKVASAARIRSGTVTPRSPRSAIRTATAGCSRRSPHDCPDVWTRTIPHSPRRQSLRPHSDVRPLHTASIKNGPASKMRTGRTGTPCTSSGSRPASRCVGLGPVPAMQS